MKRIYLLSFALTCFTINLALQSGWFSYIPAAKTWNNLSGSKQVAFLSVGVLIAGASWYTYKKYQRSEAHHGLKAVASR